MYQEDLANVGRTREYERILWFPVLEKLGFTGLKSAPKHDDYKHVIDVIGYDPQGNLTHFATRSRSELKKKNNKMVPIHPATLAKWKLQFTIRYARPTGNPVEWNKLFEMDVPLLPNYKAYGWRNKDTGVIHEYIILDVPTLQQLYREGHLNCYLDDKMRNVDWRESEFIPIPIRDLTILPNTDGLIVYHSENHPALT